jgi:hypothetical protein
LALKETGICLSVFKYAQINTYFSWVYAITLKKYTFPWRFVETAKVIYIPWGFNFATQGNWWPSRVFHFVVVHGPLLHVLTSAVLGRSLDQQLPTNKLACPPTNLLSPALWSLVVRFCLFSIFRHRHVF